MAACCSPALQNFASPGGHPISLPGGAGTTVPGAEGNLEVVGLPLSVPIPLAVWSWRQDVARAQTPALRVPVDFPGAHLDAQRCGTDSSLMGSRDRGAFPRIATGFEIRATQVRRQQLRSVE
jgi:hypothetical protein